MATFSPCPSLPASPYRFETRTGTGEEPDFLLADRPIILLPYDFEEFAEVQGFMYDYHDLRPGPAVYTQLGFLHALDEALDDPSSYVDRRHRLLEFVHTNRDARASGSRGSSIGTL